MKIISWNVNGIRAAWGHGLSAFFNTCNADIYAFQETKVNEAVKMMEIDGYYAFWSFCEKRKGYSGTLCLTKHKPIHVRYDLGRSDFDTEGRIITLEFEDFYVVNCYVPNSQGSEMRYDYRLAWDVFFIQHLSNLRHLKPTIVCGDFNVTLSDHDIYQENKFVRLNAEGFESAERENLLGIIETGFVDSYRLLHPDEEEQYSWWSNRRRKRDQNQGWRLDYCLVDELLKEKIKDSRLLTDEYGSDHCPMLLEMDMAFEKACDGDDAKEPEFAYTYQELIQMEKNGLPIDHIKRTNMTALWESIDWEQAEQHLREMQRALAKSAEKRMPERMTKWQKRIVLSLDTRLLAVRHTCHVAGGTGIDCVKWDTPHEMMSAALSLTHRGYRAMPALLVLIKCKNGKERRIHVETYFDRAMQCLYSYALDPIAEAWGDKKSFAFRKVRSHYDLNEFIKEGLTGKEAPCWIFIGDVRKCYESINHDWIMEHIPLEKYMLHQFLKAGYVFSGEKFPTEVGVGIGCTLSPIIANMVLDGLPSYIYSRLYPTRCDFDYENGNILRYADDIIATARTEETAIKIRNYIVEFLAERGLELSPYKCQIVNISEGFTFMSRTYYKVGSHVLSRPSKEAVERFKGNLYDTIMNFSGSQKKLISTINHKIDGWASYHKVGNAGETFRELDYYINLTLLQLCQKKHPKWSQNKILQKYWYKDAKEEYFFALPSKAEVRVKHLDDTRLIIHKPVDVDKNPYISWDYVEWRTHERDIHNVTGKYRQIWERQEGKCYYCGHRIIRDEEKMLIEVDPDRRSYVARMAYVHKRCLPGSFYAIDTDELPVSLDDLRIQLKEVEEKQKPKSRKHLPLFNFFKVCQKYSVTLSFNELEEILGEKLGNPAMHKRFWQQTGFGCISNCWLENGYEIKALHLEEKKPRVVFHLMEKYKNTGRIVFPDVLLQGRVPLDVKYEVENYLKQLVLKKGLSPM